MEERALDVALTTLDAAHAIDQSRGETALVSASTAMSLMLGANWSATGRCVVIVKGGVVRRVGVVTVISICTLSSAVAIAQIRFDWTPAEKTCAESIGVNLNLPAQPGSGSFLRHLTWIADVVVLGRVTEVTHDIEGDYHTMAKLDVTLTKKGQPETVPLYVNLHSGPIYLRSKAIMGDTRLEGEPSFTVGETVLLFLTKGRRSDAGNPAAYALGTGHYNLVNRTKFLVEQGSAQLVGGTGNTYELSWVNSEIDLARSTQEGSCQ